MDSLFSCPNIQWALLTLTFVLTLVRTIATAVGQKNVHVYNAPFSVGTTMSKLFASPLPFSMQISDLSPVLFSSLAFATASTHSTS